MFELNWVRDSEIMEHAYEWMRDARAHAHQHRDAVKNKNFVVIVMRMIVESGGIVPQRSRIGIGIGVGGVSSVTVNNMQRSKYLKDYAYLSYEVQVGPPELENLTENVNLHDLFDQIRQVGGGGEIVTHQNVNGESMTTTYNDSLDENMIILRYIVKVDMNREIQFSTQIIWNSRFSWRQLLQQLEENTSRYDFNFEAELMVVVATNYYVGEGLGVSTSAAQELVENLPNVIIANANGDGEMMCVVCYNNFGHHDDGDDDKFSAKRLACNHVYHSHCIVEWFKYKVSCPICLRDPRAPHPPPQ